MADPAPVGLTEDEREGEVLLEGEVMLGGRIYDVLHHSIHYQPGSGHDGCLFRLVPVSHEEAVEQVIEQASESYECLAGECMH